MFQNFWMGLFQVPDQTKPTENPQNAVADIHFPPVKTHVGGCLVIVVVVVPAFTQSYQGQKPVIAALVGRGEALLPKNVGEGIDGEGPVVKDHGAQQKAPRQTRPPINEVAQNRKGQSRNPVVLVKPPQFPKLVEIAYFGNFDIVVVRNHHPTDVGIPEG